MEILTRKIGPLPGWAWGGVAVVGGLLFFYFRRQPAQQQGQPAVSPAASTSVPFVPSVTVTGIPPGASAASNATAPSTANPPTPVWQFGFGMPKDRTRWVWHVTAGATVPGFPPGQVYPASTSDPSKIANFPAYAWQWAPVPNGTDATGQPWSDQSYAAALNASGMGGGMGGYGYAGAASLASPVGGWTVGWNPFGGAGSGAGSTVNRTGPPRRGRRLFGGAGDGPQGGQGGIGKATRVPSRPLRRRTLSGR